MKKPELTEEEIKSNLECYEHLMRGGKRDDIEFRFTAIQYVDCGKGDNLSCKSKYRLKPKPTAEDYAKAQADWIVENDIKVGDEVRIVGKAEFGERGWLKGISDKVSPRHHSHEDQIVTIDTIFDRSLICEARNQYHFKLPFFVLEKVEPTFRPWTLEEFNASGATKVRMPSMEDGVFFSILRASKYEVSVFDFGEISWPELLDGWEQLDGSPCGVDITE